MLAFFFAEDKKDIRNHFIIFIVAIGFLVAGWKFVIADMKTTALFYDSIGMQLVYSAKDQIFSGTSTEGALFGITISIWQIYCGYKIAMEKDSKRRNTWWGVRIGSGIIDTYTDVGYRSFTFGNLPLTINTLLVSIFVYNLFSEVIVSIGFKEVIGNFWTIPHLFKQIAASIQQGQHVHNGKTDGHSGGGGGGDKGKPSFQPVKGGGKPEFQKGGSGNGGGGNSGGNGGGKSHHSPLPGDIENDEERTPTGNRFSGKDFNASLRKSGPIGDLPAFLQKNKG